VLWQNCDDWNVMRWSFPDKVETPLDMTCERFEFERNRGLETFRWSP
jgi:hypothetical protein